MYLILLHQNCLVNSFDVNLFTGRKY